MGAHLPEVATIHHSNHQLAILQCLRPSISTAIYSRPKVPTVLQPRLEMELVQQPTLPMAHLPEVATTHHSNHQLAILQRLRPSISTAIHSGPKVPPVLQPRLEMELVQL